MARQPFFGRGAGPQIARMDMNAATAPGRAYGQAFANMGKQIGGMIEQYGLNKQKRDESEAAFQGKFGRISEQPGGAEKILAMQNDPVIGPTLKRIQDGKGTQKDFDKFNAFTSADTEQEIQLMRKRAMESDIATKLLENENRELRNEIGQLTRDDVIAQFGAKTRIDEGKADITETTAAYLPDQITTDLRSKNSQIDARLQSIKQSEELFPLVKQYKEGQIEYQDLLKKRLLSSGTNGLTPSNSGRYREITKEIDGIMDDFATIVDGEKLTIADMIENITDSGEIVLRDDISVRAKSSIPRLEDLLKEKYELNQSRILQNVPLTDGTRRDMTQAEFDIMLRKDRDREEQAQLLKQAQLQAGSRYNVQTPTMFK